MGWMNAEMNELHVHPLHPPHSGPNFSHHHADDDEAAGA